MRDSGCRPTVYTASTHALALVVALAAAGCAAPAPSAPAAATPQFQGAADIASPRANVDVAQAVAAVCAPAATRCVDPATAAVCSDDGQWQQAPCDSDFACEDGQCHPVICQPDSKVCSGTSVKTCSSRGVSYTSSVACSVGQACLDGACVASACKPGASQCVGNAVVTCNADGTAWNHANCPAGNSCDPTGSDQGGAACLEQVCPANTSFCKNGAVLHCDGLGLTESVVEDCGTSATCAGAACVPLVCQAGSKLCNPGGLATCKADGMGWSIGPCDAGQACSGNGCVAVVCKPSETFCDGNQVASCNAKGTGATVQKICEGKASCKQGVCVDVVVVCGDGLCDASETEVSCAADCKTISLVAPDFDQLPANVPTTLPRAPRALTKNATMPWQSGRALAVFGDSLVVVDTDNGAIVRMNRQTMTVTAILPLGQRPEQVVVGPDGTIWATVRDEGFVARIPSTFLTSAQPAKVVMDQWPVGAEPIGLALAPDAKMLFVTLAGENMLIALDPLTGKELGRGMTAARPKAVTATLGGTVFVLHGDGATAVVTVAALTAKSPDGLVAKLPLTPLRVNNPVPVCQGLTTKPKRVANRAFSMTIEPESGDVLITHTLIASGSAQDVLSAVGIKPPDAPQKFVQKCTGGYGSTCSMVPVPPPPGEPACVGAPMRPYEVTISRLSVGGMLKATVAEQPILDIASSRSFLARFDQPADIIHHPTRTLALVAARGTNNVLVVNTAAADPMQWPVADIRVQDGPKAIAISLDGSKAYVLNSSNLTVSVVDLAPLLAYGDAALSLDTSVELLPKIQPLYLKAAKTAVYGSDPLPLEARLGRKVFHHALNSRLSVGNRFACATCHVDGTEDKQVWFVSEGPRQTPALAERLIDTEPYNWMGSKLTLHDNIQTTTSRMGGSGLLPAEIASLEKFLILGLKAPPNPNKQADGQLTAPQAAGKKLFEDPSVGCTGCHTPGSFTDGEQHDVGTLTEVETKVAAANGKLEKIQYNTPSLRGLFYTAPYLHDGSAATLHDALKKTATTMGKTAQLTPKQLDDLVAYLLTL